jgi:superfamily II DNA/RNA helicase
MDQADRIAEFDRFKSGEINILVASDVAARGLDVKGVSHVINFDVPWQPDDYIHRIGRTGRAGMTGIAIMLATRADAEQVSAIEKLTGLKIRRTSASNEAEPKAKPEKAEHRAKPERAEPKAKAKAEPKAKAKAEPEARKPEPKRSPKPDKPHGDRSTVVEDIKSDWNGPLPGFLSVSAD